MKSYKWMISSVIAFLIVGCQTSQEKQIQSFIDQHVATVDPLRGEANLTMYTAEVTGAAEHFDKLKELRLRLNDIYTNRDDFEFLKRMKESDQVNEPRLKRQLDKLYLAYQDSQIDPKLQKDMIELSTSITETYNNYRGSVDGEKVTMSDIYRIMTTETDVEKRKKAWLASKEVGNVIIDDYLRLVKMRNKAVRQIGFDSYHTYALASGEQDVKEVDAIFAELETLTDKPFADLKAQLDTILADQYRIPVEQLRPWHYHDPFFQRTPLVYELNLDDIYAKHDVAQLCIDYYAGVGLPVDDIMDRSDLYDKPGKNPHAFAEDIDRHGDVRILANLNNDERWVETALHELGHAVYFKYHDPSEPYLLREPAHAFTTEAVAMFFGRLSRNASWMQEILDLTDAQKTRLEEVTWKYLRFQQILFARWAMVMYNFEKAIYADPDQDLNRLWWQLVQKYQLVNPPDAPVDAGWASKLHFTVAPCYYHNYMLGELLASQWHNYIAQNVLRRPSDRDISYTNDPRIGQYFRNEVFGPGAVYPWNEMIRRSTGETLTPKYFAQQFIR
ncbi:MAG: M3 family oligoendopeptidase [Sedimentisphaerales bacterium]|nr:M3 family oligoendopeptidase [Sedimentisphaerales bacterium]